jgi:hypothetical protein
MKKGKNESKVEKFNFQKILMFLISLFERIVILLNMRFGKIEKIIYS